MFSANIMFPDNEGMFSETNRFSIVSFPNSQETLKSIAPLKKYEEKKHLSHQLQCI